MSVEYGVLALHKNRIHPSEPEEEGAINQDNETHKSTDSNHNSTDEQTKTKFQEEKGRRQSVRMSVV